METTDEVLRVRYEIRNNLDREVWVCESISDRADAEVFLGEDNQTLQIRRCLDVPTSAAFYSPVSGTYVRLRSAESRSESVSLPIPVYFNTVFAKPALRKEAVSACRLSLEIGYYSEDLPAMIREVLEKMENVRDPRADKRLAAIKTYFGGIVPFNKENERVRVRDERIVVPYSFQALKGEQSLRVVIDGQKIPYVGQQVSYAGHSAPDMSRCRRIEIEFRPSMLPFFFPYVSEQRLLSDAERQYLRSLRQTVVEEVVGLKALVADVADTNNGTGTTVLEESLAEVACYRDDGV